MTDLTQAASSLFSLAVPCHNEEAAIMPYLEATLPVLDSYKAEHKGFTYEIILVDDGSSDHTLEHMREASANHTCVRYVSLSRNFGKESAMYAGLAAASGQWVGLMDVDLQDPPALLPELIDAVRSGTCSVARVRRVSRAGEPKIRSWFARHFYQLINTISTTEIADGARDYQVMDRKVCDAILDVSERNRFFKGITSWVGFRTRWFEFENIERTSGESQWSFFGLVRYAISGITAFSTAPLQLASWTGFTCFFISLVMLVFLVARAAIFGDPVPGWPSLVCIITLIGGIQLLCIGVLGQYLASTYIETKRRPLFLVEETNVETLPVP